VPVQLAVARSVTDVQQKVQLNPQVGTQTGSKDTVGTHTHMPACIVDINHTRHTHGGQAGIKGSPVGFTCQSMVVSA